MPLKDASALGSYSYYSGLLSNPNVQATLDAIATAEGTIGRGKQDGYATHYGYGKEVQSFDQHPDEARTAGKHTSTAAGRYQALSGTWNEVAGAVGIPGFSPRDQDVFAIARADQRGALKEMIAGDIKGFASKARKEWASFPGASYKDQTMRSMASIETAFQSAFQKHSVAALEEAPTPTFQQDYVPDMAMREIDPIDVPRSAFGEAIDPDYQTANPPTGIPTPSAFDPRTALGFDRANPAARDMMDAISSMNLGEVQGPPMGPVSTPSLGEVQGPSMGPAPAPSMGEVQGPPMGAPSAPSVGLNVGVAPQRSWGPSASSLSTGYNRANPAARGMMDAISAPSMAPAPSPVSAAPSMAPAAPSFTASTPSAGLPAGFYDHPMQATQPDIDPIDVPGSAIGPMPAAPPSVMAPQKVAPAPQKTSTAKSASILGGLIGGIPGAIMGGVFGNTQMGKGLSSAISGMFGNRSPDYAGIAKGAYGSGGMPGTGTYGIHGTSRGKGGFEQFGSGFVGPGSGGWADAGQGSRQGSAADSDQM